MQGYNLKIPLAIVSNYKVSALAVLIYGEVYGICSKKKPCYITDKTLMERHHSKKTPTQKAVSELKKANLIKRLPSHRKEERKLELLPMIETEKTVNRFILIPNYLLNDTSIKRIDELVYGYLVSESKKQEKINLDKGLENAIPFVITTKSNLAKIFHKDTRTIKRSITRLKKAKYLDYDSINGKYLEIEIFSYYEIFTETSKKSPVPDHLLLHPCPTNFSNLGQSIVSTYVKIGHRPMSKSGIEFVEKWVSIRPKSKGHYSNLCQNRVSTYVKNGYRPMSKSGIDLCQNRATNRIYNRVINKEDKSSSNKDPAHSKKTDHTPLHENELVDKPVYYDSLPSENDIPPKTRKESSKDIQELNKLSIQQSASKYSKDQTLKHSAKSGSEEASKDKKTAPKHKKEQNKKDSAKSIQQESSKTIIKTESKYEPYNGFNLDYQCKELQNILRRKTGKRYTITTQPPLIEQRLKDGFTLDDFESAVTYLFNKGQSFSIKDLVTNISNYKNKINSN